MKTGHTKRTAVAPVLATLMMIAVAVAMSVIIFVWSQGFLSQTSSAAGGQQSQQNIAAQSSVSIDTTTFVTGSGTTNTPTVTLIVRNVGAVSETMGSLLVQGVPTNAGFTGSIICSDFSQTSGSSGTCTSPSLAYVQSSPAVSGAGNTLSKSKAAVITLFINSAGASYTLTPGDIINIKIATTAGTFATQQFTIP